MTDTPVEAYVITPEQLRARDERIIDLTLERITYLFGVVLVLDDRDYPHIIAQADEVDQ